jgi:hypothetical protein
LLAVDARVGASCDVFGKRLIALAVFLFLLFQVHFPQKLTQAFDDTHDQRENPKQQEKQKLNERQQCH